MAEEDEDDLLGEMLKASRVLAGALMLLCGTAADAGRAPRHSAAWLVPGRGGPSQVLNRRSDKYFEISRIFPAKLFVASSNAVVATKKGDVVAIQKGQLMVPLDDRPDSVCELLRHAGSAFTCLRDTDGDGAFDTYFGTQVFNAIFLGSTGDDGGFERLISPIHLSEVDPRGQSPEIYLDVRYEGFSSGLLSYTSCLRITWEDKYYPSRSCSSRPVKAELDGSNRAAIYGQKISFAGVGQKPPTVTVDYNANDFVFSSGNSFP